MPILVARINFSFWRFPVLHISACAPPKAAQSKLRTEHTICFGEHSLFLSEQMNSEQTLVEEKQKITVSFLVLGKANTIVA